MARKDPDRVELEGVTAIPMRERGEDSEGRRYWRARTTGPVRTTVWAGWAHRADVARVVGGIVSKGLPSRPAVRAGVRTVGDLLDRWIAVQEQRQRAGEIAERSLTNYRQFVAYWKDGIPDVLALSLSREIVEDTVRGWRVDGVAPRTCEGAADVLAAAFRWGEPRGFCRRLDLKDLPSTQVDAEEFVNCGYTPTRAEVDLVLAAIPAGRDRDLVELLAHTGARVGEIAALRVESWDRARGELVVSGRDRARQRRGKVATRRFPVAAGLRDLLVRLVVGRLAPEPLLPELPRDCSDLSRRTLDRACDAAGVQRFTAHGLRRLVVLELLDESDPKTVSGLTGHSVHTLLSRYVRPRPERLREVVVRAAARRAAQRQADQKVVHLPGSLGAQETGTGGDDDQ